MDRSTQARTKDEFDDVYPDIAHSIVRSVKIPVLPFSERLKYIRPDTFKIYVPASEQYDSDVDNTEAEDFKRLAGKYENRHIEKVVNKRKNNAGRVYYDILFKDHDDIEESIPWHLIHDHPDWHMIEEYEYQIASAEDKSTH